MLLDEKSYDDRTVVKFRYKEETGSESNPSLKTHRGSRWC